ncbi:Variant surface glycoprotein [Trypanosoma congolense IL3000]|uniref:Variant surface glycoprotein n=1 Tax=Trypanosoma congolense (strain IL3000) TaxID=1068625 RepID=F9WJ58_TRYCI|nr:Variant surface glycoprotein [Trypanosoma congolense IL3000]
MTRTKIWMMVMVFSGMAASAEEKNHNGAQYQVLCDLIKAGANKWREVRRREPTDTLRKALKMTLFGYGTVETLETLKSGLPKDYDDVEDTQESRDLWCGQPFYDDYGAPDRWPGYSALHDMVCLCTAGENGWPVNESKTSTNKDKLCGQDRTALKAEGGQGWGYTRHKENAHVEATWNVTVTPCLDGDGKEEGLKEALKSFIGALKLMPSTGNRNGTQLGEGSPDKDHACTGTSTRGVCVEYYPNITDGKTWWVDLDEALKKEEQIQKQHEEEEKRKQKEREQKTDETHTEALKSGSPNTKQTEAPNKDNLTEKLRKLNLTSGTLISQPSSWLLSVAILI